MLPKRVSPMSLPARRRALTAAGSVRRTASLIASGSSLESNDRLAIIASSPAMACRQFVMPQAQASADVPFTGVCPKAPLGSPENPQCPTVNEHGTVNGLAHVQEEHVLQTRSSRQGLRGCHGPQRGVDDERAATKIFRPFQIGRTFIQGNARCYELDGNGVHGIQE